jgi:hypothetical protein
MVRKQGFDRRCARYPARSVSGASFSRLHVGDITAANPDLAMHQFSRAAPLRLDREAGCSKPPHYNTNWDSYLWPGNDNPGQPALVGEFHLE